MKVEAPILSATSFSWMKKHGTSEASTLGFRPGTIPGGQLYEGSDYGFHVIGKAKTITFTLFDYLTSPGSGPHGYEVQGWKYGSSCGNFQITIFND